MKTKSFHNTTFEKGTVLGIAEMKAEFQEQAVMKIFRRENAYLSPDYVWVESGMMAANAPLTSARRAITNLTERGLLIKSSNKTKGRYGRKTFTWILKEFHKEETDIFNY